MGFFHAKLPGIMNLTPSAFYFYSIILFTTVLYAEFLWITRKIQFAFPEGEDSSMMVGIAGQSSFLRWPSQLQRPGALGMYMKGVTIWLLVLFQKIFRDRKNMVPLVALWATANAVSAILIFLIASSYFNPFIGFILGLLFITSLWPWQTALTMGHINIATTILLAGVYSTTNIITITGDLSALWLALTGAFFSCLFFSSSSAIKYFPFAFASLIFAKYKIAFENGGVFEAIRNILIPRGEAFIAYVIVPLIIAAFVLIILFSYKWLVRKIYFGNTPRLIVYTSSFFHLDMAGRSQFTLEHYLTHARNKIRQKTKWIWGLYLFWAIILYPLGPYFIFIFLIGFVTMILFWTLPNIKGGLSFYWHYIRNTQVRQKTAFRGWDEYFSARGVRTDRYFTANGIIWLPRFFMRFIPGPILIFYASVVLVIISGFIQHDSFGLANTVLVLFVALLPCIWGEMTNSPKLGRVYLSAYPGILLFIGYNLYQVDSVVITSFSSLIFMTLAIIFAWNMWKFLTDILPSRMAVSNLLKALNARDIKEFYTYRTDYNQMLIGTIHPELRKTYTIHYIDSLNEVKDGWIVIPGMVLKTSFWVTDNMRSGVDSVKDPIYKKLLETKKIEQVATEKFKTFNSSRLWIMDSEITSFNDLILRAVTATDILQGHAWLLHSRKLAKI